MIPTQEQIARAYQPLFELLCNEHVLMLLSSELNDIINAANEVSENIDELYRVRCDVEGCNLTAVNQGGWWRDSGYWCICQIHSQLGRNGKPKPEMKKEAIKREEKRKIK